MIHHNGHTYEYEPFPGPLGSEYAVINPFADTLILGRVERLRCDKMLRSYTQFEARDPRRSRMLIEDFCRRNSVRDDTRDAILSHCSRLGREVIEALIKHQTNKGKQ